MLTAIVTFFIVFYIVRIVNNQVFTLIAPKTICTDIIQWTLTRACSIKGGIVDAITYAIDVAIPPFWCYRISILISAIGFFLGLHFAYLNYGRPVTIQDGLFLVASIILDYLFGKKAYERYAKQMRAAFEPELTGHPIESMVEASLVKEGVIPDSRDLKLEEWRKNNERDS